MGALEKTRQELDATKMRLSSTQQSLHERDGYLNSLRQERRKQLEEILEMKLVSHCAVSISNLFALIYRAQLVSPLQQLQQSFQIVAGHTE